ncbi:MAG: NfeD-like protein [Lachnospiraceae bacterium]|nr:NfeD-like protein [Lachnospiraceae bacterium]
MNAWWESLGILQRILYCIAIPATLVLILQTVLVIMGFGDGASGADFNPSDTSGLDLEGDMSAGDLADGDITDAISGDFGSLKLFTIQGAVAFLATFSWVSIVCVNAGMLEIVALAIGFVCGGVMMYVVAKLLQLMAKLSENGTFKIKSMVGETAQVYLTVLPSGESGGKVTLSSTSRFAEVDAITEGAQPIPSGSRVRIVDVRGDVVVVEKDL